MSKMAVAQAIAPKDSKCPVAMLPQARRPVVPPEFLRLRILDSFAKQEPAGREQKHHVVGQPRVAALEALFKQALKEKVDVLTDIYSHFSTLLSPLRFSAKDIKAFCFAILPKYQEERDFSGLAGVFLSVAINQSHDQKFFVPVSHLACSLDYVGYQNIKRVTLDGNAGKYAGDRMSSGFLKITGDVGEGIGYNLYGGRITVCGNARTLGDSHEQHGGLIFIKGTLFLTYDTIIGGIELRAQEPKAK